MDDFSKTQLVLLGVFISFVTSMVTGVVVVSLMRQEPKGVVQTINRVVEHTIERIVSPAEKEIITETEIITKEVLIKESDLIADAVQIGFKGVFSLYTSGINGEESTVLGSGFVIDENGTMITDARIFSIVDDVHIEEKYNNLFVKYNNHKISVSIEDRDTINDVAILRPITRTSEEINAPENEDIVYTPLVFADMDTIQLGQLVIALDTKAGGEVKRGIISSLDIAIIADDETEDYVGQLNYILTDISFDETGRGSPLLSLNGEVIGLNSIDNVSGVTRAIPADKIISFIQSFDNKEIFTKEESIDKTDLQ